MPLCAVELIVLGLVSSSAVSQFLGGATLTRFFILFFFSTVTEGTVDILSMFYALKKFVCTML